MDFGKLGLWVTWTLRDLCFGHFGKLGLCITWVTWTLYSLGNLDFFCHGKVVIDRTFGSAKLFGRTSSVRFGPNDRIFSAEHRTFFPYYIQCQQHPFIFLLFLMTRMQKTLSLVFRKNRAKIGINLSYQLKIICLFIRSTVQVQFLCSFYMFGSVWFRFGKQNLD